VLFVNQNTTNELQPLEGEAMTVNKRSGLVHLLIILALSFSSLSLPVKSDDKKNKLTGTPVLWQEPGDIASRDLYWGPGGEAMKPDLSKVTFVEEKHGGYSTKYKVRDGAGNIWVAKMGKEAQSDTVASRLVWAVGYPAEVSYLVPKVTIEGKGTFENVRFEARPKDVERTEIWKWDDNPFKGTREFQGLKVMMVLINNWDIKDDNNKIVVIHNPQTGAAELHYVVSDLGGTLGKTGSFLSRSRNKPEDFVKAKFISEVKGDHIDFNYNGKRAELFRDITVEQARWIGDLLSRLTDQQLKDAFRAGNYSPEEIDMLARAMRERINELNTLPMR
jgi:hypothetical protein